MCHVTISEQELFTLFATEGLPSSSLNRFAGLTA